MKFIDTKGREHKVDIRPSRWPRKEIGRGKFQSQVGEILDDLFPGCHVLEEFPCKGDALYLDFFIPRRLIAVEVQGDQHKKFNPFFHKTQADFLAQKNRDRRKVQWCEINKIHLVKIDYGESKTNIINKLS